MSLTHFKKKFWTVFPNTLIFLGVGLVLLAVVPYLRDEIWYFLKQKKGQEFVLGGSGQRDSVFARYLSSKPILVEPVDRQFGIVIEKIGVNAPVVADVAVSDEVAYRESLKYGVAHASSSSYPSKEPGNVYLFAHSSLNFWELGKYAQVFNLLRKLEAGDRVHIFYEESDFEYRVVNKEVYKGFNTYALTRPVIEPLLTMQTCDPPGTTLNRLVVIAKLVNVKSNQRVI
ncbi:MAG: sortase [Patescibacteria group bacterium]